MSRRGGRVAAMAILIVVCAQASLAHASTSRAWTFGVSPSTAAAGTTTTLTLTSTNTSSSTLVADRIGCVVIELHPSLTPSGNPAILAVTNARRWSVVRSGNTITATANTVNGGSLDDAIRRLELVRVTQAVTPMTSTGSPFVISGAAFNTNACGGTDSAFPAPNVDAANPAGRQPVLTVVNNTAPSTADDSYTVAEDGVLSTSSSTGVLANDTDADGNPLSAQLVATTTRGALTFNANGSFTYRPSWNFNGTDSFTYRARDPYTSTTATAIITVTSVNDAPIAVDDLAATSQNAPVNIDVLSNDVDFDDPRSALSVTGVGSELNGRAEILADGRTVRFTPARDRNDANTPSGFSFGYVASDGRLESADEAVVEIRVASNAVPVCEPIAIAATEDVVAVAPAACSDGNGDPLTYSIVEAPSHGSASIAGGDLHYTPDPDFFGTDSFAYGARDTASSSAPAAVSIVVAAVNDAPVVTLSAPGARGQYSDPLAPVTVTATDVDDAGTDIALWVHGSALPTALALSDGEASTATPSHDAPGVRTAVLSGRLLGLPGSYGVEVRAKDVSGAWSSASVAVEELREDARAAFTGATTAYAPSPSSSTATLPLRATVHDITALDPASDPHPGEVALATVTFVDRSTGAQLCSAPVEPFPDDPTGGTVACDASVAVGTMTVGTIVGGRYARDDAADDVTVTVSAPPAETLVTARGAIAATSSAGTHAADAGSRIGFGLNAKFTRDHSDLQGNLSVSFISDRRAYQLDATLLDALGSARNGDIATATFSGDASLTDVSRPSAPVTVHARLRMELAITDRGEPGSSDSIAVQVFDGSRLVFSSRWDGARTVEATLQSGNVVIR